MWDSAKPQSQLAACVWNYTCDSVELQVVYVQELFMYESLWGKNYAGPSVAEMLHIQAVAYWVFLFICSHVTNTHLCKSGAFVCVCEGERHIPREVWLIQLDNDAHVLTS